MDNVAVTESSSDARLMKTLLVSGAILVAVSIGLGWALLGRSAGLELPPGSVPLLIGPTVPEFSLTERSGKTVTKADLLGKVWVADFVFTRCSGPCPTLSARMQAIQTDLAGTKDVKLVTFTLDPVNDTPSVLFDYARRFHADPDFWWFITGDKEEIVQKFVVEGLKQVYIPAQGKEDIIHSVYLIIVDKKGRIRNAHDGLDPKSRALVVRDVRQLLVEPDPAP